VKLTAWNFKPKMITKKHFIVTASLVAFLFVAACTDDAPVPKASAPAVVDSNKITREATAGSGPSLTEASKQGKFRVTVRSELDPLPLNKMHSWTVHVDTADGKIVDDAQIMVYGGMPEHKHGFPSKPQVTEALGKGDYRIEGVKFNMPGQWEMWLNIRALGLDDKVIFKFEVQ